VDRLLFLIFLFTQLVCSVRIGNLTKQMRLKQIVGILSVVLRAGRCAVDPRTKNTSDCLCVQPWIPVFHKRTHKHDPTHGFDKTHRNHTWRHLSTRRGWLLRSVHQGITINQHPGIESGTQGCDIAVEIFLGWGWLIETSVTIHCVNKVTTGGDLLLDSSTLVILHPILTGSGCWLEKHLFSARVFPLRRLLPMLRY